MAHFHGIMDAGGNAVSKGGTAKGGLRATLASWEGAVRVELYREGDVDMVKVELTTHHGVGVQQKLYDGPIGKLEGFTHPALLEAKRRLNGVSEEVHR